MSHFDEDAERARCDEATPGPWTHCCNGNFKVGCKGRYIWRDSDGANLITAYASDEEPPHRFTERDCRDLAFCAHARTDLPAACDEIAELRAEVERLRERLACATAYRTGEYMISDEDGRWLVSKDYTETYLTRGGQWVAWNNLDDEGEAMWPTLDAAFVALDGARKEQP